MQKGAISTFRPTNTEGFGRCGLGFPALPKKQLGYDQNVTKAPLSLDFACEP